MRICSDQGLIFGVGNLKRYIYWDGKSKQQHLKVVISFRLATIVCTISIYFAISSGGGCILEQLGKNYKRNGESIGKIWTVIKSFVNVRRFALIPTGVDQFSSTSLLFTTFEYLKVHYTFSTSKTACVWNGRHNLYLYF